MSTLTVLVPAFNEEATIVESLKRLKKLNIFKEVIIIDDSSTDSTYNLASKFVASDSRFKLIKTNENLGKGGSLSVAKNVIQSDYVVIHDADLEYFPEDIKEMFKHIGNNENILILGSRFIGNKKRKNIYTRTFFANKLMSSFFSFVNGCKITDVATCYKLMPASFFREVDIKEMGFAFEIEIIAKFLKQSRAVYEVPIKYEGRSYAEGKKIKTSDGIRYLMSTIKYRFLS